MAFVQILTLQIKNGVWMDEDKVNIEMDGAEIFALQEFLDVKNIHKFVSKITDQNLGEIALIGFAAAVTNAVYNATGKRVRDLPITPEKLGYKKAKV